MDEQYSSPTLRDYLKVIFRQKGVIITCVIGVLATVLIGLQMKTPLYEASVKMQVSGEKTLESPYYRDALGERLSLALTQAEIVTSNPVLERAVRKLGLHKKPLDYEKGFASPLKGKLIDLRVRKMTARLERLNRPGRLAFLYRQAVAALRKAVKVEPVRDTNLFTISARDFSPVGAAIIANTVSRSYQIFDLEQQMAELEIKYGEKHQIVQQLRDNIDHMVENLNGELLPDAEAIGPASVKIIEQAGVPMEPVGPSKLLVFLLAVVMSLFLGVMLAFMFEYMDQTFKTPFDVESSLQLPFLGYVIKRGMMDKSLIGNPRKLTPYGRTIQTLAEQLYLVMKDKQVKSTVVASCLRNEGSSVLTANLGIILSSKLHHNVLIIDANLRRPLQHKLFKIGEPAGLTQVVEGKLKLDKALVTLDTKLTLLPAGQTEFNPITLLDSGKMIAAIDELQSRHEIILIDAPPFRDYNDANLLAGIADGTVVVVSEGRTRRQVVQSAIAPLRGHGDRLLGVILNNRTYPIPRIIYDRF